MTEANKIPSPSTDTGDSPEMVEDQSNVEKTELKPKRSLFHWTNILKGFVAIFVLLLVSFFLATVIFHSNDGLFALGSWLDDNKIFLFIVRIIVYLTISVASPWIIFHGVEPISKRKELTKDYTIYFLIIFLFGEIFLVNNILAKIF